MVKEEIFFLEWKILFGFLRRNGYGGSLVVFVCCFCDYENESRWLELFDGFFDVVLWLMYCRFCFSLVRFVVERWKILVFFFR